MFTLLALIVISAIVISIAFFLISLGGTLFILIGGDLIVALFIIWFIFFRKK